MKQETLEQDAELEKLAMDKLKSKWEHLYTFGYPQKPFPTKYENDLNNVKVGLYEGAKWQQERSYNKEEVLHILDTFWDRLDVWYNRDMECDDTGINLKKWFNECELKNK